MSLDAAAREARTALENARVAISAAERAGFGGALQRAQLPGARRVAGPPRGVPRRAPAGTGHQQRQNVAGELEQLEGGQVREKLQAALQVKSSAERVLGDARAALEHITDELRSLGEWALAGRAES
jgi:chromosome segregation protein